MDGKPLLVASLVAMLVFSVTASAMAQEDLFSARLLAKAKKSTVLILMMNSSKSTESIHGIDLTFTSGQAVAALGRGWDVQRGSDTISFTSTRGGMGPGDKTILLLKVPSPASASFEWTVKDESGNVLQNDFVSRIRVETIEPPSVLPPSTVTEVNVDKVTIQQGQQLTITGKGYSPASQVILYIDQTEVGRVTTDASGTFSTVVLISNNMPNGLHLVRAVDALNKSSVIQILVESPQGALPPLQGGRLEVRIDKEEYIPGDLIRISGSAVLETPVSLQITDPQGGIICGANPRVDNRTLLWDATCVVPNNAVSGKYVINVNQIVHRTTTVFTVTGGVSGGTGGSGGSGSNGNPTEDPGPLKMTADKEKYKVGDNAVITVEGARPLSILHMVIDGPGGHLKAEVETADQNGRVVYTQTISGSDSIGTWKISAKQNDAEQTKEYIVRMSFEVEA